MFGAMCGVDTQLIIIGSWFVSQAISFVKHMTG